jgi:hypothetical protein
MTSSNSIDRYHNSVDIIQDNNELALLFSIVGDRISLGIIRSTMKTAKSAFEISKENSIPTSSVYKKIRKLEQLGMVQLYTTVADTESGKTTAYYRCRIESLKMTLDEDGIVARLRTNEKSRKNTISRA